MGKKTYQVWHDAGWPESRLNQMLAGWPPSRFPQDYVQVANVQANGLREAVQLTTDKGSVLEGNAIPWERNPGVKALASILQHRSTDQGDVIVDPQGKAYRLEQNGFIEISVGKEKKTALSELFKEWQEDYAAAKREDAHWYGKESLGELLADKSPPRPKPGKETERGIATAGAALNDEHRLEGFRAAVASDKSGSYALEDADGETRPWQELSAQGKLDFIAGAAAMYDIPFEQFVDVAWQELGDAVLEEAGLRSALQYRKELRDVAKLIPDNGRTELMPLAERLQELLDYEPAHRAGLLAYDTTESVKTTLESFSDEFERLARTPEQKKLVAAFKEFVGEVTQSNMRETFDRLLRRFDEGRTPQRGDRGIER